MNEFKNNIDLNKKENVLERLTKRNKERQNNLETKLEQRQKETTNFEGVDYFMNTFTEKAKSIEKNINNIQQNTNDLKKMFCTINNDLQELQKYLSQSTLFLPDYNIKTCQNILNDLTLKNEEVKEKLIPKKKFGFHNKKIGLKTGLNVSGIDKTDFSGKSTISDSFIWTLANKENEYIYLTDSFVNNKDITISNVKNCFIEIRGHGGSLQLSNAENCTLLCGPISRSIFAENCINCQIVAACQQLRLHASSYLKLYIHVSCKAVIEDCTKIEVSKYNYKYPGIEIDFNKCGLNMEINNYKDVADFNWLSADVHSPNWQLMSQEYEVVDWESIKDGFKRKNAK